MASNHSKIVYMPDIEYTKWLNDNKDIIKRICESNSIPTIWLNKGSNKKFLVRYFKECGFTITFN